MIETMTDSTVESRSPSPASDRPTIIISLPSGWGRAAAAGIGAALAGWFIPVVLASVAFWLVADSPWLQNMSWQNAIDAGSAFWALSLGVPTTLGGVALSLIPLLWTLTQIFILRALLRSTRHFSGGAPWAAIPFFSLTSLVIALSSTDATWWHVLLGSAGLSAAGACWASLAQSRAYPGWMNRLAPVWSGMRIGAVWVLILVGSTGVAAVASWINHREAVAEAGAAIGATGPNGLILVLLQIAYLPTALAWGFAWLLGPGFVAVGGQVVTPADPAETPLPLPMWQMLPSEAIHLPAWPWPLVALGLLFGAGAGWLLRRRSVKDAGLGLAGAAATALLLIAGWMSLSTGSMGDNQLALLGPSPAAVTLQMLLLLLLPAALIVALLHPLTMQGARWLIARIRDRAAVPEVASPASETAQTIESAMEEAADAPKQ